MYCDDSDTIQIECDAPPYPIVQACRKIGFHCPEDDRWSYPCSARPAPKERRGIWRLPLIRSLFGNSPPKQASCVCGHAYPALARYKFVLCSGKGIYLDLGQCRRCHTIFWQLP